MTRSERIEAAARAMWGEAFIARIKRRPGNGKSFFGDIERAIDAAYPELADGTAWVAPWEATGEMLNAVRKVWDDDTRLAAAYPAMRDAHLSPNTEGRTG